MKHSRVTECASSSSDARRRALVERARLGQRRWRYRERRAQCAAYRRHAQRAGQCRLAATPARPHEPDGRRRCAPNTAAAGSRDPAAAACVSRGLPPLLVEFGLDRADVAAGAVGAHPAGPRAAARSRRCRRTSASGGSPSASGSATPAAQCAHRVMPIIAPSRRGPAVSLSDSVRQAPVTGRVGEAGLPLLGELAERRGRAELAQHADRAERHPVDQQVGRRQVEHAGRPAPPRGADRRAGRPARASTRG